MRYLMVGERHVDPETTKWVYVKEFYRQGFVFKDEQAFLFAPDDVCYIAEDDYPHEEKHYTRKDIVRICDGNVDLATVIFYLLDWQHSETLMDEYRRENKEPLF